MPAILFLCRRHLPTMMLVFIVMLVLSGFRSRVNLQPAETIVDPKDTSEWNYLRQLIQAKKDSLEEVFKSRKSKPSANQLAGYSEIQERILRLTAVLKNLDILERSTQLYSLQNLEGLPGELREGGTFYKAIENNRIEFKIGKLNVLSFIHETTHGGQFEKGGLSFSKAEGVAVGNDLDDELEAYKAEYAFDSFEVSHLPSISTPHSFGTITASWILGLQTSPGIYLFKLSKRDTNGAPIGLIPVTIEADQVLLQRAYPCLDFPMGPGDRPLKNEMFFYYKQGRP